MGSILINNGIQINTIFIFIGWKTSQEAPQKAP